MLVIFTNHDGHIEGTSYNSFEEYLEYHDDLQGVLYAWLADHTTLYSPRLVESAELEKWLAESKRDAKEEIDNENFERRIV